MPDPQEAIWCTWCDWVEKFADHRRMHPACKTCVTPSAYRKRALGREIHDGVSAAAARIRP